MEIYRLGFNKNTLTQILIIGTTFTVSACGGGGGSSSNGGSPSVAGNAAPQVVNTSPDHGEANVPRDQIIRVEFDEDILNTSVDSNSYYLVDAEGLPLDGMLEFQGLTNTSIEFTPDALLGLLSTYSATVTTAVADLSGNPLASDFSWEFTTEDGSWGESESIGNESPLTVGSVRIGVNPNGVAHAIWESWDGTSNSIWSARFTPANGWESPEMISDDNPLTGAQDPVISVGRLGFATAAWLQHDGLTDSIWSARYSPVAGWDAPEPIEDQDTGIAGDVELSTDANGDVVAVWLLNDGMRSNVWSNRFTAGVGWGGEELIEMDDTGGAGTPQVGTDADGNAIAVWEQYNGVNYNIWSNRYTLSAGWGIPELIENNDIDSAGEAHISVNRHGTAVAVWAETAGSIANIWSNSYTPTTGWGDAELIETTDLGEAYSPKVSLDLNGNAVAIWTQTDGSTYSIWSNHFVASAGWQTAELIETDDAGDAFAPRISIDNQGNAIAVWEQSNGSIYSIWSNRFTIENGWETAQVREDSDTNAFSPDVGISSSGEAIVVWGQNAEILTTRFY